MRPKDLNFFIFWSTFTIAFQVHIGSYLVQITLITTIFRLFKFNTLCEKSSFRVLGFEMSHQTPFFCVLQLTDCACRAEDKGRKDFFSENEVQKSAFSSTTLAWIVQKWMKNMLNHSHLCIVQFWRKFKVLKFGPT